MTRTIYERVTGWMAQQAHKHDLGADYVERTVNAMSPLELLEAISQAVADQAAENDLCARLYLETGAALDITAGRFVPRGPGEPDAFYRARALKAAGFVA